MNSGRIEWNRQSWPATGMGAKEFGRTQGRRSTWLGEVAEVWRRWCAEEEPGLAVTTSGTTGTQKHIRHSRKATAFSVAQTTEALDLAKGCHAVLALPTAFVAGQAMLIRALIGHWRLTLVEPSAVPSWSENVDFTAMTPHQAEGWLKQGTGSTNTLLLGGGPVSSALLRGLHSSNRVSNIWEGFGMSETLTHVALRHLDSIAALTAPFVPLPETRVVADARGCARIDAPGREVHGLSTSDLVDVNDAGSFVWLGRMDNVVNSGGVLVHPEEVEQAFHTICPNWVNDFVVYGRPEETLGFEVVLRVQIAESGRDLDHAFSTWRSQLKSLLGTAKTPRSVELGQVPRTDRGKVQRRTLP